ncbi:uncharacterized protein C20orf204 homolog [Rhinatrema bivittatum]|uniref:uncharacterized protein C20orf204 homolog n=1 Tax=Rhinatrema bivittatum TaxID=194408 RepID=UPI001127799C|nr:uncharacterized protein C20orf204 homolog [Rhinatrema bivittatum]
MLTALSVPSEGQSDCNIAEILQHYRAVLFQDLQTLKILAGAARSRPGVKGRAGPSCRPQKEQRILQSLHTLTLSLGCEVSAPGRSLLEKAVQRVVLQMASLVHQSCRTTHQQHKKEKNVGCKTQDLTTEPHSKTRKRRLKVIRHTAAKLAVCWEKLHYLHRKPGSLS